MILCIRSVPILSIERIIYVPFALNHLEHLYLLFVGIYFVKSALRDCFGFVFIRFVMYSKIALIGSVPSVELL